MATASTQMSLTDARNINLLRELTVSQFKLKDQSTFFGLLWSFLNPLVMVLILFVFFAHRFGQNVENYGIFLLLGMVQYTHFANATSNSMRALLTMRQLTRETVFPKELIVVSSVVSNTIDFGIAMGVCLAAAYVTGVVPALLHLSILAVILLQFLLVLWVSMLLACVFPLARDIEHIYQVFLRALLFITPIFYTKAFLGEGAAQMLLTLNPLAQLISVSRDVLIQGQVPDAERWVVLVLANLVAVWLSWRLFKALEPRFAEYV
jgi:ABC-type polysaccharide/polyol phosphate export permease